MALAPSGRFLCGPRSRDRRGRILRAVLAGANGSKRPRSRPEYPQAVRAGSSKLASVQAAQGGIAVRNGRSAKAAGHAANDRAGREAGGSIHSDDSERGGKFWVFNSKQNGKASRDAAVLLRDAVRYRG